MKVLEVKHLSFGYKPNKPVLNNVCFSIGYGETVCILGPNGCGKTTFLSQIVFPSPSSKKAVYLRDEPYENISLKERARLISFVPQTIQAYHLTVFQTILLGRTPHMASTFLRPTKNDVEIAEELLQRFNLSDMRDVKLVSLSGGERQRVFIAQSLAKEAKLFIFDEPMSALDPKYQNEFLLLIKQLNESGVAVIFTTHNPNHFFSLKGIRLGVINEDKSYSELNVSDSKDIRRIEQIFKNSVRIRFSSDNKSYFAEFTTDRKDDSNDR